MLRNVSLTALAGLTIVLLGCSGGGNDRREPYRTAADQQPEEVALVSPGGGSPG